MGVETAPNFFVIGAPKAGTTSLYRYLGEHPDVYMSPIKEPAFFAPEVVDFTPAARAAHEADAPLLREYLDGPLSAPRAYGIVLQWQDYLKLFKNAGAAVARGEVSGTYLSSASAPAAIGERLPDARIIAILRDPADRLFSQYSSALSAGHASGSFRRWTMEHSRTESTRAPTYGPIWTGMYAQHLKRYRSVFAVEQIRTYLYEDYRDRAKDVLADIFRFLGVDPTHPINTAVRHNVTTVPLWPALDRVLKQLKPLAMSMMPARAEARVRRWYRRPRPPGPTIEDRGRVIEIYEEDIRELETLIGRDLRAWLRPKANDQVCRSVV